MIYALDNEGNRVSAEYADKKKQYFCPICSTEVIPKQGELNIWHFAHKNACPDTWSHDMSEWHREMQSMFPFECQEVVIEHNGVKHRADVLVDDVVIEFQHSTISSGEFCERNDFYRAAGYRLAWVFDMRDADLEYRDSKGSGDLAVYKYPKRFLERAPVLGDNVRDFAIWFCVGDDDDMHFEKVVWHTPDWKRIVFCARYLGKDAEAHAFVETRDEYIQSLLKGHVYRVKRSGQRSFPRDNYVCPKRPAEFGIDLFGEMGCSYCKHCAVIVDKSKGRDVYCTFPEQFNESIENAHPGYEYSARWI